MTDVEIERARCAKIARTFTVDAARFPVKLPQPIHDGVFKMVNDTALAIADAIEDPTVLPREE